VPLKYASIAQKCDSTEWHPLNDLTNAVSNCPNKSLRGSLPHRSSWRSIRTLSSPNLGTNETHSHRRHAPWKCNFRRRIRHKLLSHSSRVFSSKIRLTSSNSSQIELFLSFGASRWEVGRTLLLKPGLRTAILPTITQMR
jgi:hypothetical protein